MLTVLEVLVVIEVAIWMVISMLLRSKLVHLLGTSSKLIWAAIPSHGHYLLSVGFTRKVGNEAYSALGLAAEQTSAPQLQIVGRDSYLGSCPDSCRDSFQG